MEDCTKSTKRFAENLVKVEEEREAEASNASLLSKITNPTSEEVNELKLPLLENDPSVVASPHKPSPPLAASCFVSVLGSDLSAHYGSSKDIIKSAVLKGTNFETEVSTCNNKFSKEETSLLIEINGGSEKDQTSMDSPRILNSNEEDEPEKIPTAAEINEFFAGAEKQQQKRFAEKYNYDIVKDAPLEGRYLWIRLNKET